jgi:hypothetical protein
MIFRIVNDDLRIIDFEIAMTALEPISISRAKHSFFAIRVAPDVAPTGGGRMESSTGNASEKAILGKSADWCDCTGKRVGHEDVTEGVAVFDHPSNPWHPCPWFARDYGHLSPSPFAFLDKPWEAVTSSIIRLRYAVVLHVGTPKEAELDRVYKEWAKT